MKTKYIYICDEENNTEEYRILYDKFLFRSNRPLKKKNLTKTKIKNWLKKATIYIKTPNRVYPGVITQIIFDDNDYYDYIYYRPLNKPLKNKELLIEEITKELLFILLGKKA